MFGAIQSESGFDMCESRVSDIYPERDGSRTGEVGSVVVAPNDVSELADGDGERGETGLAEGVDPGPEN